MGNFIKAVDEFFSVIIPDEMGRFFCLHLPFWGLVIYISWHVTEYVGLFLVWAVLVFWLTPCLIARIGLKVLAEAELSHYESKWTPLKVSVSVYFISILVLIGIPGWYSGYFMQLIESPAFAEVYWGFIVIWWKVFNFYRSYKLKELQEFLQIFGFSYKSWQIAFLVSSSVIVPILFYRFYTKTREQAQLDELAQSRHEDELRLKRRQEEARVKELEERERLNEKRVLQEQQAQKEEKKKIQEKINEVKGKNPWDSGFL